MVAISVKPKLPAMARNSRLDLAVARLGDQSTRSILLTASITFLMPTRSQIAAWRRVWRLAPWRASTSRMAMSACEAPVAMLRVYCSWPGESMMTKRRSRRLEIAPGDVDGDALLALGLEPVEQQAEIDLLAVDGAIVRGERDRRALVLGDAGGIPQQPADQRRLAVVDRAAGEQPDHAAVLRSGSRHGLPPSRSPLSAQPDMHQK